MTVFELIRLKARGVFQWRNFIRLCIKTSLCTSVKIITKPEFIFNHVYSGKAFRNVKGQTGFQDSFYILFIMPSYLSNFSVLRSKIL